MGKNKIITRQNILAILFFVILTVIFGYVIVSPPINGVILLCVTPVIAIVWIIGCILLKNNVIDLCANIAAKRKQSFLNFSKITSNEKSPTPVRLHRPAHCSL